MKDFYFNFVTGVKNLWFWVPVIWRDRDWDYAFLLKIMEAKMRRMSVCIEHNDITVNSQKAAQQLRVSAALCRRIHNDEYFTNLTGPLVHNHHWEGDNFYLETYRNGELLDGKEYKRFGDMAERNLKNDIEYLTFLMRKYLRSWWE